MDETAAARVMFVSNKYPFPADDGKKTVLAGFLDYLVQRHGVDRVLYIVVGPPPEGPLSAPWRTVWITPPGAFRQAWNVVTRAAGGRSLQELATYAPRVRRALRRQVREFRPQLLILDTLRVAQYFWDDGGDGCRRVLYMDDLLYLRFQRLIDLSAADAGQSLKAAGTFAQFLPETVRGLLDRPWLRARLYRTEMRRIERRELACPARFDRCLLINPNEVDILRARCGGGSVHAVKPWLGEVPARPRRSYHGQAVFVMFGSLRHPVYRASVADFLQRGMAEIVSELPAFRIDIIGGGADDGIRALCARFPDHVRLCGYVESIEAAFAGACAMLAPMVAAGGLKLKVITALAHGLPLIASHHAVDGIPLEDGCDYLLENEPARYATAMRRLCDPQLNARISASARRAFDRHFGRDVVFAEYDALFGLTGG